MKEYLLLYTIGPVQSYIEQSRKVHDLYSASNILSTLTEKALEKVSENVKNKIIIPYYDKNQNGMYISYPNRFVAIINLEEDEEILDYAQKLDKHIRDYYVTLIVSIYGEQCKKNQSKKQVEDHLKTQWTSYEYDISKGYIEQYEQLERSMGAIKNIRDFDQLVMESKVKPCVLCGEREGIYNIEQGKNRKICGVCQIKRKNNKTEDNEFQSTADIALAYWIEKLRSKEEGRKLYDEYLKEYNKSNPEEKFTCQMLLEHQYVDTKEKKETEKKKIEIDQFMKKEFPENIKHRYYAIVLFDGDDMGRWFKGEKFKAKKYMQSQKKLTQTLSEYAKKVREIIKKDREKGIKIENQTEEFKKVKLGSVVYAGGEDFMGLIPLDELFETLELLRKTFRETMSNGIRDMLKEELKDNQELTFSMGVCIAHYKEPLSRVLQEVREAERRAKDYREKKDCLSISLLKHSGENIHTVLPWGSNEDKYTTQFLTNISEIFKINTEAYSFIQKIQKEFQVLVNAKDIEEENGSVIEEMFLSEKNRIISKIDLEEGTKNKLIENIDSIYARLSDEEKINKKISNFIGALHVCEFIRREQNEN